MKFFKWFVPLVLVVICLSLTVGYCYSEDIPKYNRALHFGSGWIDADGDCQNTRAEVLIEESLIPVVFTPNGCAVLTGLWYCEFTDKYFTIASDVDIDHRVPLKEAWISGAYKWTKKERVLYANDLSNAEHLIAVDDSSNQSKGAKDPALWLPTVNQEKYIKDWIRVKRIYGLTFDAKEVKAIRICR